MGTRSLTYVLDEDNRTLCQIYRQMDGYPEGQGQDLYDCLAGRHLVNGFNLDDKERERWPFNGMGCLAAALVHDLKTEIGSIYLYPPTPIENLQEEAERHWAEWVYVLYPGKDKKCSEIRITLSITAARKFLTGQ